MPFERTSNRGIFLVLAIAGLLGFLVGTLVLPRHHVAVETGQALAGVVQYDKTNVSRVYHSRLWNLTAQGAAFFLKLGVPERVLSRLLSGLIGAMYIQGLALIAFAFSRNVFFSLSLALITVAFRLDDLGPVYPVHALGTIHSFGALGLSAALLTLGLLVNDLRRCALFAAAICPAIHPVMGLWVCGFTLLGFVILHRRPPEPAVLGWFAAGLAITLLSFLVSRIQAIYPNYATEPGFTQAVLNMYAQYWDFHRRPMNINWIMSHEGTRVAFVLMLPALAALTSDRIELPSGARAFLWTLLAMTATGFALALWVWLLPEYSPGLLMGAMPGRFLNFALAASFAVWGGIIWTRRRSPVYVLFFAVMVVWFIMGREHRDWGRGPIMLTALHGLLFLLLLPRWPGELNPAWFKIFAVLAGLTALLTFTRGAGLKPLYPFTDYTNSAFWKKTHASARLLLVHGDIQLTQLRARRPNLVDPGALDFVPYFPDTAPYLHRMLKEVYEVDLLTVPEIRFRGAGRLSPGIHGKIWVKRTRAQWAALAKKWKFDHVLVFASVKLDLDLVAADEHYRLYAAPR